MPDLIEHVSKVERRVRNNVFLTFLIGLDEQHIHTFAERWGGLNLRAFARALQEGTPQDQQVAAFALGSTRSRWARDVLLPFLHHNQPEVRWAVALELGKVREAAAFPVLLQMLQEFLPPHGAVDYDWYDVRHLNVAHLLGLWGKQEAIPILRETLLRLWRAERQHAANTDIQLWWRYQDALVYALGQLGAFHALRDIDAPPSRMTFWAITLVMGYLNAEEFAKKTVVEILLDAEREPELRALLTPVPELLQHRMGFSLEEATTFTQSYHYEYLNRWEEGAPHF